MRHPLAYLLAHAGALATRYSDAALRPYGLTTRQYGLLAQLDLEPELTTSELARQLDVSRQTLHEMIGGLERAGYLVRAPGATGRTRRLALTPQAVRRLPRLRRVLQDAEEEFFEGVSPAAAETLRRLLQGVLAHVTDDESWLP
ncbi:MarR family winged helix-turn-helix transcriptional regulator [Cryptosporangium aurantiacum]|uniref:DNA-binding transcriptional regulator, MarR family n=1 Tax=Cryptosporangium aurantiacum TaxID=134849 RepID=A0A1M7H2J6_9ACTN|nr:MarR family transcriptional regulator [Cryptosporangium aurantiacum]SHM22855.1 DNA-binding transcriptional regulator, MarR family [Cryptosporangium aurantiacum]